MLEQSESIRSLLITSGSFWTIGPMLHKLDSPAAALLLKRHNFLPWMITEVHSFWSCVVVLPQPQVILLIILFLFFLLFCKLYLDHGFAVYSSIFQGFTKEDLNLCLKYTQCDHLRESRASLVVHYSSWIDSGILRIKILKATI